MADDTNVAATTPADDAANQKAPVANTDSETPADTEPISPDDLRKLRSEARTLRQRAKDAEGKLTTLEQEKLTDSEKLVQRAETAEGKLSRLEKQLQTYHLQSAISETASDLKLKVGRPAAIAKLMDSEKLDFDDDGKPSSSSVAKELKRVKEEWPELFQVAAGSADGGAGAHVPATEDVNSMIRRMAKR